MWMSDATFSGSYSDSGRVRHTFYTVISGKEKKTRLPVLLSWRKLSMSTKITTERGISVAILVLIKRINH